VGRSIFNPAARAWFAGRMSDEDAVADVAARYERLIESWRALRARATVAGKLERVTGQRA
jgi:5-dehydro-2-deoxygluconokinase